MVQGRGVERHVEIFVGVLEGEAGSVDSAGNLKEGSEEVQGGMGPCTWVAESEEVHQHNDGPRGQGVEKIYGGCGQVCGENPASLNDLLHIHTHTHTQGEGGGGRENGTNNTLPTYIAHDSHW